MGVLYPLVAIARATFIVGQTAATVVAMIFSFYQQGAAMPSATIG
jgi:hypothetical protein